MFTWAKSQTTRRTAETSGAYDGTPQIARGLLSGTCIASEMGWRPVEALAAGDGVLTFDHGMVPVQEVRRQQCFIDATHVPAAAWPIHIPAGALGNAQDARVLPDQAVMVESDTADDAFGDPFAIVPAKSLIGWNGVVQTPCHQRIDTVHLIFDRDVVVYSDGGLLVHCPRVTNIIDMLAGHHQSDTAYRTIRGPEAASILAGVVPNTQQHLM